MKSFVFYSLFFVLSYSLFAQKKPADTLMLMNGNIVVSPVLDTTLFAATFVDPKDSLKKQHLEFFNIFAIRYHTGEMVYYYKQDTLSNWFTRDEMYLYMQGERDARKGFRAPGSRYGTMACGLVGGLSGTFFGPLLPMLYFGLVGLPKIKIKHNTVSNPDYLEHDAYLLGYERVARKRRRIQSLIGGGIGLVAGYVLYACLHSYYPAGLK
ncbi:MAG: hypothetical protein JST67_00300 [Bacteroidetes bacterium]|nr:hypothetical protein [Bacteroidota bacterium]